MPLSRNAIARNKKTHQNSAQKQIKRLDTDLTNICNKHKIGDLSFRSCKLAGTNGKITFVDHETIKGNLKNGVMIVKATKIEQSNDNIYDIYQIECDKKERDEKKRQDELEKARIEIDRIKNNESKLIDDNQNNQHQELLKQMINDTSGNIVDRHIDQPTDQTTDIVANLNDIISTTNDIIVSPIDSTINSTIDPLTKPMTKKERKLNNRTAKAKRAKAVSDIKKQMVPDRKIVGNKFYRNFIKDLRSKFTLEPISEYKYFEVKSDSTYMVVDNVQSYRIVMPTNVNEIYMMFVGDLQMKSGLIKQIDPAYQSDKTLDNQSEFLKRIIEQDNITTTEIIDDTIDNIVDVIDDTIDYVADDNIANDTDIINDTTDLQIIETTNDIDLIDK